MGDLITSVVIFLHEDQPKEEIKYLLHSVVCAKGQSVCVRALLLFG